MNIFTDGSREFGKYPLSIYGNEVLKFFTYVIPIALFQYYPLLYLIGRSDRIFLLFLPLLGFVFMIPCYCFFSIRAQKIPIYRFIKVKEPRRSRARSGWPSAIPCKNPRTWTWDLFMYSVFFPWSMI